MDLGDLTNAIETVQQATQHPLCRVVLQGALNALIAHTYTKLNEDRIDQSNTPYFLGYILPSFTAMIELPYVAGNEQVDHIRYLGTVATINSLVHLRQLVRNWHDGKIIAELKNNG